MQDIFKINEKNGLFFTRCSNQENQVYMLLTRILADWLFIFLVFILASLLLPAYNSNRSS